MIKRLNCRLLCVGIIFGLRGFEAENDVTLTPTMLRIETSPKPSTVPKRIVLHKHYEANTASPMDLLLANGQELRRKASSSDIWNWDYWCQLQPKTGNCTKHIRRYYYDAQLDQCLSFTYSGCKGNKNRFDTFTDCERYCKGAMYMVLKEGNHGSSGACYLQPNVGLCLAMNFQFYFDVNDNKCRPFTYGGCGGNLNRFETFYKCHKTCMKSSPSNDAELSD